MSKHTGVKILLISNKRNTSENLSHFLKKQNLFIKILLPGTTTLKETLTNRFQLILINSQEKDFNNILTEIEIFRQKGCKTPILLIRDTSKIEEEIDAFNAGINLLHKPPVNFHLLLAEINKLLEDSYPIHAIERKDLLIRPREGRCFRSGEELFLTKSELDLFLLLIKTNGSVLTRGSIMSNILNCNRDITPCAVDTMICRLRKKLGRSKNVIIETVRGRGYRLSTDYLERKFVDDN